MIDTDHIVDVNKAIETLKYGGILLSPTDTVWGLMCDFENTEAVSSIFTIKKSHPKPMAILVSSLESINSLQIQFTAAAQIIANAYWPGPITLVMKSDSDIISPIIGTNNSVGVRMPDSEELLKFIELYGKPIAATSANIAGQPPPKAFDDISESIRKQADYISYFNIYPSGINSTVIDCTTESIELIREGSVSFKEVQHLVGNYDR